MGNLINLTNRTEPPKYTKFEDKPEASHLVNYKPIKKYDYYICDYCKDTIKLLNDKYKMTGGIVTIPKIITKSKELKLALCNKCLKPVLKEFEGRK